MEIQIHMSIIVTDGIAKMPPLLLITENELRKCKQTNKQKNSSLVFTSRQIKCSIKK